MTPAEFHAALGQPKEVRPAEYAPGVNGPPGTWYLYSFDDAESHILFITVDINGKVTDFNESIRFAKYANGGSDAAHFSDSEEDGKDGTIFVEGTPYDLNGNQLDPQEMFDEMYQKWLRDQGQ